MAPSELHPPPPPPDFSRRPKAELPGRPGLGETETSLAEAEMGDAGGVEGSEGPPSAVVAEGPTLKELFSSCAEACDALAGGVSSARTGPQAPKVSDLVRDLALCSRMVNELALFSDNEDKDDVSTASLPYLLLPYYEGVALVNADPRAEPEVRLKLLDQAVQKFRDYARQCDAKGLLEGGVRGFVGRLGEGGTLTFGREEKIDLYRRQKELARAREALERLGAGEEDEETARSLCLLRINGCAMSAYQLYASVQRETEILEFERQRRAEGEVDRRSSQQQQKWQGRRPEGHDDRIRGMVTIQPGDLGPAPVPVVGAATLARHQADRERFARGVFKQSHLPYTMTVEEFGEQELARMRERERERDVGLEGEAGKGGCCSDEDEDDECVKKAREWDDFKDDNPRGWGNKNLRPCA